MIRAAFGVFFCTVLYVVGKRLPMIPVAIGQLAIKLAIGIPILLGLIYLCCCGGFRR